MGRSIDRRPPAWCVSGVTFNHADARQLAANGDAPSIAGDAAVVGTSLDVDVVNSVSDHMTNPSAAQGFNFGNGIGVDDDPFTMMAWMKADAYTKAYQHIFFRQPGTTTCDGIQFVHRANTTRLDLYIGNGWIGGGKYIGGRYERSTPTGVWHHYAVTYDGLRSVGGVYVYVNGVVVNRTTTYSSGYNGSVRTNAITNTGESVEGFVDGQIVANRVLTANEVATVYQQGRR